MQLKNELAAVVTFVGFVALTVGLAGAATLLGVAFGGGNGVSALLGSLATTVGFAGVIGVALVLSSGYFEEPEGGSQSPTTEDGVESEPGAA